MPSGWPRPVQAEIGETMFVLAIALGGVAVAVVAVLVGVVRMLGASK
jgi:hypothetical protein